MGWAKLKNTRLMGAAEGDGFDVLITRGKGFRYGRNLKHRRINVVLLNRVECFVPSGPVSGENPAG